MIRINMPYDVAIVHFVLLLIVLSIIFLMIRTHYKFKGEQKCRIERQKSYNNGFQIGYKRGYLEGMAKKTEDIAAELHKFTDSPEPNFN